MAAMYLLNTVDYNSPHGIVKIPAGRLVTDLEEQLEIMAVDGTLWPASDVQVAIAAKVVTNLRMLRGLDDTAAGQMMSLAAQQSLLSSSGGGKRQTDHYVPTFGQTAFPLSQIPVQPDQTLFVLNGILYEYGTDFTVTAMTLTWTNPMTLASSDNAFANYGV